MQKTHTHACDSKTILWPCAKEKVRSSGHEPVGLHVNSFTVGAHLKGLEQGSRLSLGRLWRSHNPLAWALKRKQISQAWLTLSQKPRCTINLGNSPPLDRIETKVAMLFKIWLLKHATETSRSTSACIKICA